MKTLFRFTAFILLLIVCCTKPRLLPPPETPELPVLVEEIAGKIVILGSSTAVGTGANPIDSCWVKLLEQNLRLDKPLISVTNLSVPGFTSYHIMPDGFSQPVGRPKPAVAGNLTKALGLKPDLVIINLPTNDVVNNYSDDEIFANFEKVTMTLQDEGIPFIVTGTQPRNVSLQKRLRLKDLNTKLQLIYGPKLFDYYNLLSTTDYTIQEKYSAGDGIHLNNAGHSIVYKNLVRFDVFKDYLNRH